MKSKVREIEYLLRVRREIIAGIVALRAGKKTAFVVFRGFDRRDPADTVVRQEKSFRSVTAEEFARWKLDYDQLSAEQRREPWEDILGDDERT